LTFVRLWILLIQVVQLFAELVILIVEIEAPKAAAPGMGWNV
jgi:hypothetical protein